MKSALPHRRQNDDVVIVVPVDVIALIRNLILWNLTCSFARLQMLSKLRRVVSTQIVHQLSLKEAFRSKMSLGEHTFKAGIDLLLQQPNRNEKVQFSSSSRSMTKIQTNHVKSLAQQRSWKHL